MPLRNAQPPLHTGAVISRSAKTLPLRNFFGCRGMMSCAAATRQRREGLQSAACTPLDIPHATARDSSQSAHSLPGSLPQHGQVVRRPCSAPQRAKELANHVPMLRTESGKRSPVHCPGEEIQQLCLILCLWSVEEVPHPLQKPIEGNCLPCVENTSIIPWQQL